MQVFRGGRVPNWHNSHVAVGAFDGMHLGHQALIAKTVREARTQRRKAVVLTFDPHPEALLRGRAPAVLTPEPERIERIGQLGVDGVVVFPFTRRFAQLSAESFVREVLGGQLRAAAVHVGFNFVFGKGGQATVWTLKELGQKCGIEVDVYPPVEVDGQVVSSTAIRRLLGEGEVELAGRMLGRDYAVEGQVVRGEGRGHTLGFPTANLQTQTGLCLPATGVYAGWAEIEGERWPALANIGVRPTFGQGERTVEIHLLDFTGDLYGEVLRFSFSLRLRDERAFATPGELVQQIKEDAMLAREFLQRRDARTNDPLLIARRLVRGENTAGPSGAQTSRVSRPDKD